MSQLPDEEFARIAEALQPVSLTLGTEVSQPNEPIEYIYFPESGLISTDALTRSGESVEVGLVGREGISGLPALFGQPQMGHAVLVQGEGRGYRIRASLLREVFLDGGELRRMIHNFTYLQFIQISQSVLCNRLHDVETRLARWLLMSADRTESDQLHLTQEFLAQMLGVQRSTVTVAAGVLQRSGMIEYSRGKILILNRAMLKEAACECYHIVNEGYEKLLKRDDEGNLIYV
ncbi:Crp/Fnr family transcriptional regulator [Edaphobacter sp. HDX4]|uniref:Crp/Fnr family transcriptional regulator n=1 Tax=Edaphobacter sp. HDX4 TaxID=2794064 RepID=UPI002FE6A639